MARRSLWIAPLLAVIVFLCLPDAPHGPGRAAALLSLEHSPPEPKPGEAVTVTASVSPDEPIQTMTLLVQTVDPGRYIRSTDPSYKRSWIEFPMEKTSGEDPTDPLLFTATVPAEIQQHRRLVRYRITAVGPDGAAFQWPDPTNASPNRAWFVYDRPPAWTGASKPGSTPALEFSSEFLSTLPIYHLIARKTDVENSQWDPSYNRRPFLGTLVCYGKVYDHIRFHNRGQASTYLAGKNKWGFSFNPGEGLRARDLWGREYKTPWSSFNLNACASPWAQVNRGMAGLDEAVGYRAYQLAGVPSPDVHWIHFRVIDSAEELSHHSQFEGDLWGLYIVVQDKNGDWLRENNLPDGNIFSAESGPKHLAPGMAQDGSDWSRFVAACRRRQPEEWWRAHFDLPAYYSFHAINRVIANIDLRPDGNHYLYARPDGRWMILPHDLDMMFIPKTHQPGYVIQSRCLDIPALKLEYQNRAREILDLFCSDPAPNGGQIGQLIAEFSRVLAPPDHPRNWAELDEAMWNWNPRNNARGQFFVTPYRDHRMGGTWRRTLSTPDFAGFCKYIVEFCTDSRPSKNYRVNDGNQLGYGYGYLWLESKDEEIPERPTLTALPEGVLVNDELVFQISPFASPASAEFAALQWRIAEIAAPGLTGYQPGKPFRYEIEPPQTGGELNAPVKELRLSANVCEPGRTYRTRVRYKDTTGRWSHWSNPIQFVTAR